MSGLFDKLLAILRRDALDSVRRRAGFAAQVLGLAAELAGFYFLARAIGPQFRPDGIDYYPFLLLGTAMFTFVLSGVNAFVGTIQQAQMTGTMEVVMTTATPPPVILGLSAFSSFAGPALRMIVYIAAGLMLYHGTVDPNWGAAAVIILLSVALAIAIGMLAGSAQVWMQKGNAIMWLFGLVGWVVTGTAFPISSLPRILQRIADFVPVTYSISGLRAALLPATAPGHLLQPIIILALYVVILLPSSVFLFSFVVRRARMEGTLSFY